MIICFDLSSFSYTCMGSNLTDIVDIQYIHKYIHIYIHTIVVEESYLRNTYIHTFIHFAAFHLCILLTHDDINIFHCIPVCVNLDYEVVQLLINILQFNYPETLESALIVDSPFLFYACWAVIRPWLGTNISIDSVLW